MVCDDRWAYLIRREDPKVFITGRLKDEIPLSFGRRVVWVLRRKYGVRLRVDGGRITHIIIQSDRISSGIMIEVYRNYECYCTIVSYNGETVEEMLSNALKAFEELIMKGENNG